MGNEICLGSFESGFFDFFFEVDSDLQKLLCSWFFEKKKKLSCHAWLQKPNLEQYFFNPVLSNKSICFEIQEITYSKVSLYNQEHFSIFS